ncbi:MAG: ATP-binding protein [Kofleriaceae bacterium]
MNRSRGGVKLQPADAFDLIRWLARSQSDPRKAVAELVQNGVDANAKTIMIERRRRGRRPVLIVRDDGEGIRPAEEREQALRYIATHIGRSHKRNLSARERHEQIVAGQYGIGLLGFWSIGRRMDIRSRVGAGATWLLRLIEDEPRAEVVPGPPAIDDAATFTEIVISDLHAAATRALSTRRLAEYLGAELRGTLIASGVSIELREYDARGVLVERIPVVPRRFDGIRLDVAPQIVVPGFPPIFVELYHVGGDGIVELTCAGTVVAEGLAELAGLGLARAPWIDRALGGTIEFAALSVPPGTRRGVVPDAAAEALVAALAQLAPTVQAALDRFAVQRHAASERQMVVDLRRALRGLRDRLPHLAMPAPLLGRGARGARGDDRTSDPLGSTIARGDARPAGDTPNPDTSNPRGGDEPTAEPAEPDDPPVVPALLPPGPAHHIRIAPDPIRVWPGGQKKVRARVFDVHGQEIAAAVTWIASSSDLTIDARDGAAVVGLAELCDATALAITVAADANGGSCTATVEVVVIEAPTAGRIGAGIPEPVLVDDPARAWRSRLSPAGWEVNIGHLDYGALATDARARLRYLVALFAKDLTLSVSHPAHEAVLDQMLDVLSLSERNLLRPR